MQVEQIRDLAINALEDMKAEEIKTLDVKGLTSVTDFMIICNGRSSRHSKSIADNLTMESKKHKLQPLSVTGMEQGEWILVDLGDVVVHVMLAETREFYELEKLWSKVEESRQETS